ncbi:MAG: hypothetical protein Q8K32_32945 [Archangium sp.]|nr:hypothetical protein [Archangium sp.]
MFNLGDDYFSAAFAVAMGLHQLVCLLSLGAAALVLAGRAHLQQVAWSAFVLALASTGFAAGWGLVHGSHGLSLAPAERLEAVMEGFAPALNALVLGMLSCTLAAFLALLAALRRARVKSAGPSLTERPG